MKLKSSIYRGLRISNDLSALARGRYPQRVARRVTIRKTVGLLRRFLG